MLTLDTGDRYVEASIDNVKRYYSPKPDNRPGASEASTETRVDANCLDHQISNLLDHH